MGKLLPLNINQEEIAQEVDITIAIPKGISIDGEQIGILYADKYISGNINEETTSSEYTAAFINKQEKKTMDNDALLTQYIENMNNERRASEERTNKKIESIEERMDNRLNRIEDKLDSTQNRLLEKMDSTQKWVIGICLTAFLGIAAIVIPIMITILFHPSSPVSK